MIFPVSVMVSEHRMARRRGAGRGRGGRRAQNDDLDRDFEIEELKRQVQELQEQLDQRNLRG